MNWSLVILIQYLHPYQHELVARNIIIITYIPVNMNSIARNFINTYIHINMNKYARNFINIYIPVNLNWSFRNFINNYIPVNMNWSFVILSIPTSLPT